MKRCGNYGLGATLVVLVVLSAIETLLAEQFGLFTFEVVGETVQITDYPQDAEGSVEIPESIDGRPVASIGNSAFSQCRLITSVDVPTSVTSLETWAFSNCSALTEVSLPSGLTSIGTGAFLSTALESIAIPSNVDSLGPSVFFGCTALTSVSLPDGLEVLPDHLFEGCAALEAITLPPATTTIGESAFQGSGLAHLALPGSATQIGSRAFFGTPLTSVILSSAAPQALVGSIGASAFENCTSLETVEIPKGVSTIGESAFENCTALNDIAIPQGVVTIGESAFEECTSLQTVIIPEGVTSIGASAFRCWAASGCRSELVTVHLPDSLLSLGWGCFYDCRKLANIALPPNLVSIEERAFFYCTVLPAVAFPSSLESIGEKAFAGCLVLSAVTIPRSVMSIGAAPFHACRSLLSVSVEPENERYHSIDGVLFDSLQKELIQFPPGRTDSYVVPESVTAIAASAFEFCQLESVLIPATVESIGADAFCGCEFLEEIDVAAGNASYRSIDGVLFNISGTILIRYPAGRAGAYAIPSGTERIVENAFAVSLQLTGLVVPASVNRIDRSAFSWSPLQFLSFAGDAPSLRSGALSSLSPSAAIIHLDSATGFDRWQSARIVAVNESAHPASRWMLDHGVSPNVSLNADLNGDGISLLQAYALGLDPNANLSGSLPSIRWGVEGVSLNYFAASPGVSYLPEASPDLKDWSSEGILLSNNGDQQTATLPLDGTKGFLRLSVDYDGPGTAELRPGEELKISFESAEEGAFMGYGNDGDLDSLGWADRGSATVLREEISGDDTPVWTGPALIVHDGTADLVSEAVAITALPNREVAVSIDFRTFENSSLSNFEDEDRVEAWIEGSRNGVDFLRIEGAEVVPLTTGDWDLIDNNPPDPNVDDLKKLELPAGAYSTFSTDGDVSIPPEFRFIRIRLSAENNSGSEWFFIDTICVRAAGQP